MRVGIIPLGESLCWLGDSTPRYQPRGYSQVFIEVLIVTLFWNKHRRKVKEIRCESSNVIPKAGKMNESGAMVMNWVNLETYCKMEKAGCRMIYTMALHSTSIYLFKKYLCIWLCRSLIAACGVSAWSSWNLVLWWGIDTRPPALGVWTHWTTKVLPQAFIQSTYCVPGPEGTVVNKADANPYAQGRWTISKQIKCGFYQLEVMVVCRDMSGFRSFAVKGHDIPSNVPCCCQDYI